MRIFNPQILHPLSLAHLHALRHRQQFLVSRLHERECIWNDSNTKYAGKEVGVKGVGGTSVEVDVC
jgi:hypothetical protein